MCGVPAPTPTPPNPHQFLCDGIEDDYQLRLATAGETVRPAELLVWPSGKMLLLAKLLPKLRAEVGGARWR